MVIKTLELQKPNLALPVTGEQRHERQRATERWRDSSAGLFIFLTVGSVEPFDRLVESVDRWAGEHPAGSHVFAQIGNGSYTPKNMRYVRFLQPDEYIKTFAQADLVIGHAGMGTIITALEYKRMLALLPRLVECGEARNQHQLATVRRFGQLKTVRVAESDEELPAVLNEALQSLAMLDASVEMEPEAEIPTADPSLIAFVRDFISTND